MKLMDKVPKMWRGKEELTPEKERELHALIEFGERAERLIQNPDYQSIFRPISQAYWRRKLDQSYAETDAGKKLQLLGNAQAVDELATEISNVIQAGKKAALELQTKRTKP